MVLDRRLDLAEKSTPSEAVVTVIYFEGADYIPGTTVASPPRSTFAQILWSGDAHVVLKTAESVEPGTVFSAKVFDRKRPEWKLLKLICKSVRVHKRHPHYFLVEALA